MARLEGAGRLVRVQAPVSPELEITEIHTRLLAFLKQPEPPGGWREAMEMAPLLKAALAMKPRTVARAPCQEVVLRGPDIDLGMLPIQTCWPGEPAPLITWPLVVTKGPGGARADDFNLGIYRMRVRSRNTTLMRWLRHP